MTRKPDTQKTTALRWLLSVTKPDLGGVAVLTVTETLLGASGVASAWLLRGLIDAAVSKSADGFRRYALLLVLLVVCQIALRALQRFLAEYTKAGVENRLKSRLFGTLLRKDYAAVTAIHSGEWMNRLTSDTVVAAEGVATILPGAVGMLVRLIGAAALLVYMIPKSAWIIFPGGILLAVLTYFFRKVLKRLHKRIQESDGRLRIFLSERLSNLLIVRSFAREGETARDADARMETHKRARMKRNGFSNAANTGFGFIMRGAYIAAAIICGYGILRGTMTYGSFTAVLQLVNQIESPFANITGYLPKYYAMLASAERLSEAEAYPEEPEEPMSGDDARALYAERFRAIEFDRVSFAYPRGNPEKPAEKEKNDARAESGEDGADGRSSRAAITDVSFVIGKGELVAMTGPSGSGKSTVLKLLLGLYAPDSGTISIRLTNDAAGGEKTQKTPLTAAHRSLFAYVPQGNQLMSGTIREAVSFGDPGTMRDDDALWEALRVADADSFVAALPEGLDTPLGERGSGLSEGQLQRLAIARAIRSERPILLLDEATSALDEATEARVLMNLRGMTDRTVILVTHRPGALLAATKRIPLDGAENEALSGCNREERILT